MSTTVGSQRDLGYTRHIVVGRDRELDLLHTEQKRSELGELRVALVLGEAGSGKTALAAELLPGEDELAIGLTIYCSPFRRLPVFGHWLAELDRYVNDPDVDTIVDKSGLGSLPAFLRRAGIMNNATSSSDALRNEFVARIPDLFAKASMDRPIVVIIDDAHEGDDAVWEMLLRLALDFPTNRLFVLVIARSGRLAEHRCAAGVLQVLEQNAMLRRIHLAPLGREEIRELATQILRQDIVAPAVMDWLMARSMGNPQFAVGLLEALLDHGADLQEPELSGVPEKLVSWVHAEVMRLEPSTLPLLELLAVVDGPVDPDVLARIAGEPVEDVALTLERLVGYGMVVEREHDLSLSYRIAQPILREVIYARIGGARRRVMHRRVAATLFESGLATAAASRSARSGQVGEGAAIDALLEEARRAEQRGSYSQVWTVIQKLLALLPSGDKCWHEVVDVLSQRSGWGCANRTERYPTITTAAVQQIQQRLAGLGNLRRRAGVHLWLADLYTYGAGSSVTGMRECKRAATLYQQAGCVREFRMAEIESARIRGRAGDLRGEELAARQLLHEAERAKDQHAIVEALGAWGHALGWQGCFAEAEKVILRCVGLATTASHAAWKSRSLALLAALDACQGHLISARTRWAQAVACGPPHDPVIWDSGAFLALLAGDLAMIRMPTRQTAAHDPAAQPHQPGKWGVLAVLAAAESDRITEAHRILDDMPSASPCDNLNLAAPLTWWAEGGVAWAEGRLGDATSALQRAADGYATMNASALINFVLADLAEIAVAAGNDDAAVRAATQADHNARHTNAPSHQALDQFTAAWALLGRGYHDEAARAALCAVREFGSSGYTLLAARAQFAYAIAIRHDDPDTAADVLREAVTVFDSCGAVLRREQAHKLLTQLESDVWCTADSSALAPLTTRERQVAELATRGYTARQIANELHIGTRTVETHLQRIYPKLGVTCKQQLVRRAVKFGFTPGP